MWADLSLNCFSGYELDSHYGDCFQSNIAYVILKGSLQPAIFIHGRVPTWIKDWSLFNHLLSLREMFWLASHGLATLSFEAPTCAFVCARWTNSRQSCHRRKRGFDDDSFTNGPHLINPKSGHMDTLEERLLYGEWSEQSHTSQTTLRSPRLSIHVSRISIFSAYTKEIYAHLVCQSWPDKPVYVLNTAGTLDIPASHCHRQVKTEISASTKSPALLKCWRFNLGWSSLFCPKPQFCVH